MADDQRVHADGPRMHGDDLRVAGDDLRVRGASDPAGFIRGRPFSFRFEGREITAYPGETIATALLAAGTRRLRSTRQGGRPRGLFCAIGACFDCLVRVDGGRPVRACATRAEANLDVAPGDLDRGDPEDAWHDEGWHDEGPDDDGREPCDEDPA